LDRDIPVGAVIIDSPWETRYNTFEFDSNRYPDAEQLITNLRNVRDQQHNWGTRGLPMALNDMFISADLGYGTVGSDIGGYLKFIWVDGGNIPIAPDKNLLIRWGQLGAMMPIMENGGTSEYQHLPWNFDQQTVDIYRYFSKLHHQLAPFFYSYIIDAHNTGTSIVRVIGEGSANDTSN